jgi:hypothetical protein
MSLLLSRVGAPPAAPTFAPRQVRPVTVDDGSIEIRGVIRLGAFVAAVAAVAVFAPAIIRPTAVEPAPVQSGQVRTATAPRAIAFPVERPVTLDEPTVPPGRIATGWFVASTPVVVVWSPSTQRVTLPEIDTIPGRITVGWQVTSAAPATVWAPPLRTPQLLDTAATATGRVQTAPLPPRAWVPAHIRAAALEDRPSLFGRIVAPIVHQIRVALRIVPSLPVDLVASRAGQVSVGVTVTAAAGPSTPIDIVRVDTPNVVTSLRVDTADTVGVPNTTTSAHAPNTAEAVAVPNLVTSIAPPNRVEQIAVVATRTGTMTPHQTTTAAAANTTTHTTNPEGIV